MTRRASMPSVLGAEERACRLAASASASSESRGQLTQDPLEVALVQRLGDRVVHSGLEAGRVPLLDEAQLVSRGEFDPEVLTFEG